MRRLTQGGVFGGKLRGKTAQLAVKHSSACVPLPIYDGAHGVRFNDLTLAVFSTFQGSNPNLARFVGTTVWSTEKASNAYTPGLFHFNEEQGATTLTNSGTAPGATGTCAGGTIVTRRVTDDINDPTPMAGAGALKTTGAAGSNATIGADVGFSFGTEPFTIEFLYRGATNTSTSLGRFVFADNSSTATVGNFSIRMNASLAGDGYFDVFSQTTSLSGGGGDGVSHNMGVVQQIALVRNGTDVFLFVDGVRYIAATVSAGAVFGTGNGFVIGTNNTGGAGTIGMFDELVVTKGVAKYLTSYNSPQPIPREPATAFAMTNVADGSGRSPVVTPAGVTLVVPNVSVLIGALPDADVTLPGAPGISGCGAVSSKGDANKTLPGVVAARSVGVLGANGTISATAVLAGAQRASGFGALSAVGSAGQVFPGASSASGTGAPSVAGSAETSAVGAGAAGGAGTAAGAGAGDASIAGISTPTEVGTIVASGPTNISAPILGAEATSGTASAAAMGDGVGAPLGVTAAGGAGAVGASGAAAADLVGALRASGVGTVAVWGAAAAPMVGAIGNGGVEPPAADGTAGVDVSGALVLSTPGVTVGVGGANVDLADAGAVGSVGGVVALGTISASAVMSGVIAAGGVGGVVGSGTQGAVAAVAGADAFALVGLTAANGTGVAAPSGGGAAAASGALGGTGDGHVAMLGAATAAITGSVTIAAVSFAGLIGAQLIPYPGELAGEGDAFATTTGASVYSDAATQIGINTLRADPRRVCTVMPELRAHLAHAGPGATVVAEVRRVVVPATSKVTVG